MYCFFFAKIVKSGRYYRLTFTNNRKIQAKKEKAAPKKNSEAGWLFSFSIQWIKANFLLPIIFFTP
jgi:hypothetical protein